MVDIPRHRESVDFTDPVSTSWVAPISYDRHYSKRTMDDVVTSDYARRSASGEVIINPLTFVSENHLMTDDECTFHRYSKTPDLISVPDCASANIMRAIIGYVPQIFNIDGEPLDGDVDYEIELKKQLALSFVDEPQFGFGEDLFEIGETIRFLANPTKSIIALFKAFDKKAAKVTSAKDVINDSVKKAEAIAKVWAEYSFAILPLVRSIEEAIEALYTSETLSLRRTSRSKGSVVNREVSYRSGSYSGISSLYIPPCGGMAEIIRATSVDFSIGLTYESEQSLGLRSKLGLRNKDLIVTAWEVLPLSFMIDRIVSIKNALKSFLVLTDSNVDVLGGFVTKRESVEYSIQLVDFELTTTEYTELSWFAFPHVSQTFTYTREKWDPSFANSITLPNPVELVNSASKVADLLSLLTLNIGPLIRKYYS